MKYYSGLTPRASMRTMHYVAGYTDERSPGSGYGFATAHHGELLQGVFEDQQGQLRRGLVTLPCDLFFSEATFAPSLHNEITIEPSWKYKARRAAEIMFAHYQIKSWGGHITIQSNIPTNWGLGSSTCDIVAALRSIIDAFDLVVSPDIIAQLAVKAEATSASLMFEDRAVFFAHYDGIVIEDFNAKLPMFEVVGFNTNHEGVGTLKVTPAEYSWREIESFRPLVGLLRRAIYERDPKLLACVTSASACLNQRFLPKPDFDAIKYIATSAGALGFQVAHSGTVVGILFDPRDANKTKKIQHVQGLIAEMKFNPVWHFVSGYNS